MKSIQNTLYLDCEFTDLAKPELLSLGMVSEDGDEHYVELDLADPASAQTLNSCSDFVQENNVLGQWNLIPHSKCSRRLMGERTARWVLDQVARHGQPAVIAFDFVPDYQLFERLIRDAGQWAVVSPFCNGVDVSEMTGRLDSQLGADRIYGLLRRRGLERHHALADAFALRGACYAYETGKRPQL
jgi:hypothetical protein